MNSTLVQRLHRMAAIWGPAGREEKIAALLTELIEPYVDEVRRDPFGNLIARKNGQGGKRIMLAAHMDTIGAIAMQVKESGLIKLAQVGDLAAHNALGQRVLWGSGAVGVLQHEPVKEPKEIEFRKLFCDIGAADQTEAAEQVPIGEMCVLMGELQQLGDNLVGPGLDNRAGCAVLLEVAEHLSQTEHEVLFCFTAQGEIGPRGAGPAAYGTDPDLAFVLDVGASYEPPTGTKVNVKLGKGPALKLKDGAYMAHQALSDLVRQVGEEQAIPVQIEIIPSPHGRNDAQVVSIAGQGIPTAVIDIPARYRGTGAEMVNTRDLYGAADLLLKLLAHPLHWE
jgi:putative aminopeptidase FrvX